MIDPPTDWGKVVAVVAALRASLWRSRLNRPVEYDGAALGELAQAAYRSCADADTDADTDAAIEAAMTLIEQGIMHIELPWQTEWHTLQIGGSRA